MFTLKVNSPVNFIFKIFFILYPFNINFQDKSENFAPIQHIPPSAGDGLEEKGQKKIRQLKSTTIKTPAKTKNIQKSGPEFGVYFFYST